MHSRYLRKYGPWWILLTFTALWFINSPAGAASPTVVNHEIMSPPGTGAQSPVREQEVAGVETYQGTQVGFTADGHPFRGNPNAPLTLVEYTDYVCPFCELYF